MAYSITLKCSLLLFSILILQGMQRWSTKVDAAAVVGVVGKELLPLAWWQETIVYQIYPRSFQDSDGDGTGDLKGIQSRLDYLVELGVGAVWLSPIYKSPMVDFGYDISNFTDVDPIFGTLDDFKALATEMHAKGIKVIMDFIPNHSSDQHPWFLDSVKRIEPYTDYYTWKNHTGMNDTTDPPTPTPPNNWVGVFGGSMWTWNDDRQQFYLHQFAIQQPDLRLENPAVAQALLDAMDFWMDLGVDGFRMDAVPHMFENQTFPDEPPSETADPDTPEDEYAYWDHPYTFNLPEVLVSLVEYRQLLDKKSEADGIERCMMTEGYVTPLTDLMKYYGTDEEPIAHFPFNFELIGISDFTSNVVKAAIDGWMSAMPEGRWANWLVGNHDNARVSSRFDAALVDAVNMIVLLLPGTAVTYYGEELGMTDTFLTWEQTKDPAGCNAGVDRYQLFSRDPERTPMQWDSSNNSGFSDADETWLPVNPNYELLNVKLQNEAPESHLKVYKDLAALRKTDDWKYGTLETKTFGNVFGFARVLDSNGFIVLANLGKDNVVLSADFAGTPLSAKATIYARSVGFSGGDVGSLVNLKSLSLQAGNAYVLKFTSDIVETTTLSDLTTTHDGDRNSGNTQKLMLSTLVVCIVAIFIEYLF